MVRLAGMEWRDNVPTNRGSTAYRELPAREIRTRVERVEGSEEQREQGRLKQESDPA